MKSPDSGLSFQKWYVSFLASFYLVLFGASSVYYFYQDVRFGGAYAPWTTQAACGALAFAAALYFLRPRIGYYALLILTVLVLLISGIEGHAAAVRFQTVVLFLLSIPLVSYYGPALIRTE